MMQFKDAFKLLTDYPPFPWQEALYRDWFSTGNFPATCSLPTGLGKTSVVAVWLIALAHHPEQVPRRLVYVVNRRTVVDQTTNEIEKYRAAIQNLVALQPMREQLANLCALPLIDKNNKSVSPFALSTLRGQFADNREWSADPARPAVIVGTVDMIGSRLLFSGYGVGFKSKPLHAGFLGQDVLLVHDEAHLEPAFQKLLIGVECEQRRCKEFRKFQVMELSATSRGETEAFGLSDNDRANNEVMKRIAAKKAISLSKLDDEKQLADRIAKLAQGDHTKNRSVLVFVRKVDDVEKIIKQLPKGATQQLTGTLRGLERDRMADPRKATGCPIFARFLKPPKPDADETELWNVEPKAGTVYLVCTSAGEVGVNISADHMVCDLSTFESMAQRFGRVNRFGDCKDTEIRIVHPVKFDKNDLETRRANTLAILENLNGDGSPKALGDVPLSLRLAAFAAEPTTLPASDILFDAWALTTIKGILPGRPPVSQYLHGIEDDEAFETHFAWREEVTLLTGKVGSDEIEELLDLARLKPHESLRVSTFGRAYNQLRKIADRTPELPVWIIEPDGSLITDKTISDLVLKRGANYNISLASRTVILPPKAGGLTATGTLDGSEAYSADRRYDVAGLESESPLLRFKVRVDADGDSWLEPVASITGFPDDFHAELPAGANRFRDLNAELRRLKMLPVRPKLSLKLASASNGEDETSTGIQEYLVLQSIQPNKENDKPPAWPALNIHSDGVRGCALAICKSLKFDEQLTRAIELSGAWHDLGKGRAVWQRGAGNDKAHSPVAKTIHGRPPENLNRYRHELGSLIDICGASELAKEFEGLTEDQRDVVLHLIAVHHGRGRPHFPDIESHDIDSPAAVVESVVKDVPSRFARLQRQYGRWGLAYLESILRAADILDSQRIEATPLGEPVVGNWLKPTMKVLKLTPKPSPTPSIRINVDPTNPGQFFACCGLLELADRLWPGAEGWFEEGKFCVTCGKTSRELISILITIPPTEITRLECNGLEVKPIIAPLAFSFDGGETIAITLDAWMKIQNVKGVPSAIANPPWNFWSGQQTSQSIWLGLREKLAGQLAQLNTDEFENLFSLRLFQKGRFGFDPGPAWNALDVGFSPNEQGLEVESSPAVELLAAVGLQRFRPVIGDNRESFDYMIWHIPLSPSIAAAAMCGGLADSSSVRFRGCVVSRGQYAALGFSYPVSKGVSRE